jgi:hypothetical protein
MPAKRSVVLFDKEEEDVDNSSKKKKKNVIVDDNIQPLHDLALNFNIDIIEPYLREYLKDVQTNDNEGDNNNEEDNKNTADAATMTQQTFTMEQLNYKPQLGYTNIRWNIYIN